MKTKLFYLFACVLCVLSFTACSSDDEGGNISETDLVGCWLLYSEYGWSKENGVLVDEYNNEDLNNIRVTYYEDGTGKEEYYGGRYWYSPDYFTWSLKGKKLTEVYDDGETVVINIKTLNKTTLAFEMAEKYVDDGVKCEDYEVETYKKISD
jgi:hypothetical protein